MNKYTLGHQRDNGCRLLLSVISCWECCTIWDMQQTPIYTRVGVSCCLWTEQHLSGIFLEQMRWGWPEGEDMSMDSTRNHFSLVCKRLD
ncbi:Uhrf1-Binding Protein 1-Like [Manis pentadactyla]|nr:Uhrf1-Binding Protein 1-Like [Manis pentadactyla]